MGPRRPQEASLAVRVALGWGEALKRGRGVVALSKDTPGRYVAGLWL